MVSGFRFQFPHLLALNPRHSFLVPLHLLIVIGTPIPETSVTVI
jgi:hypothetical protein